MNITPLCRSCETCASWQPDAYPHPDDGLCQLLGTPRKRWEAPGCWWSGTRNQEVSQNAAYTRRSRR